jgi:ATP-dependent Lhr-like helicase
VTSQNSPHPPPSPDLGFAERWFAERGWTPFEFQREVWAAMAAGESGLLHATTGAGKTYAVGLGALARAAALGIDLSARQAPPLGILWLTPMRALAADTTRALALPLTPLAPAWTVGLRSGDTPSAERARQDRRWPSVLVTTPESLSLMLTREHAQAELQGVHTVVVDEWHELIGNKRGVQVQLALARLQRWNPQLVVWGVSATLGNLDEAMATLLGPQRAGRLVRGRVPKELRIDTLLPADAGRFSWGGHLGAQMRDPVVAQIEQAATSLIFTNTRSQAEIWYQLLLDARPDWAGLIALHHGSLDPSVRGWVEAGLKAGALKAVVATSSLDLGVDFLPVERVLQIGSAKGIARLLQRAGRSGHAPGRPSRITLVPTNTMELVEAAAAREAALAGRVEARKSPDAPLDVLVQHLVTVALGGGFRRRGRVG